jgi:death-on-curing protein
VTDPEFLDLEDVLLIHEEQLATYGGAAGIRDQGLLESALAQPQATFGGQFVHANLFAMAAAYAFHIAKNQPFVDGNKRMGVLAAVVFLELNGYIVVEPPSRFYEAMIAVAERRLSRQGGPGGHAARDVADDPRRHGGVGQGAGGGCQRPAQTLPNGWREPPARGRQPRSPAR